MEDIIKQISSAKKKRLFWKKPVYVKHADVSLDKIRNLENQLGIKLPEDLQTWLLSMGFGIINKCLYLDDKWFHVLEEDAGLLDGFVLFAQDDLGNHLAFNPNDEESNKIYYISHDPPGFAIVSESFHQFIKKFVNHEYEMEALINPLEFKDFGGNG